MAVRSRSVAAARSSESAPVLPVVAAHSARNPKTTLGGITADLESDSLDRSASVSGRPRSHDRAIGWR